MQQVDIARGKLLKKRVMFVLCALLLATAPFSMEAHAELSVVTPPDRTAVKDELLTVVVSLYDTQIDELQIFVNNRRQKSVAVKPDRKIVCMDGITLSPGNNKIRIAAIKEKKKLGEQNLSVFLRMPLTPTWTSLPEGFSESAFHGSFITKICVACHQLEFKEAQDTAAYGEKSPCYLCHKKLLSSYMVVHGPAAVWSCLMCHSQSSDKGKAGAFVADNHSCVKCHDQAMILWKSKKFIHGPLVDGDCITCHNPHASSFGYLLRLSAYDLCVACHDHVVKSPHVITGFSGGWHPLRLPRNPLKAGSEFSCASCHNPHASDFPFFLYNYKGPEGKTEYCKSCHAF